MSGKAPTMAQLMCKHEQCTNLKFILGQGQAKKCNACGVILVDRYRSEQPANIPGTKVRMSKKERRALKAAKKQEAQNAADPA